MRPTIAILDVTTGKTQVVEMTEEQLAQYEKDRIEAEARAEAQAKALEEQEAAKKSAMEKLAALGLTDEEIQALAG